MNHIAKKIYNVIGVMSGTSLDGLDVALCNFVFKNDSWHYEIKAAHTYKYSKLWQQKLKFAEQLCALDIVKLNNEYGRFIGLTINKFLKDCKSKNIDFIASHGHTVFHNPSEQYTYQLGSGAAIAATTGITTICDFRSLDVALSGQGAPLVPIGDQLLFSNFSHCLNLGGFANISFTKNKKLVAFDICPVNTILNYFARQNNKDYDKDGLIAKSGKIHTNLLNELNSLPYYKQTYPKSLSVEWNNAYLFPLLNKYKLSDNDKMRTLYEHIVQQILNVLRDFKHPKVLVTGGGAHNIFLIYLLDTALPNAFIIPPKEIIDFKEALIFAFLGLLRMNNEPNCIASVTGSKYNNCGGAIYFSNHLK